MRTIAVCLAGGLSVPAAHAEPVKLWSNVSEAQFPALPAVAKTMGWMWAPPLQQAAPAGKIGVLWFSWGRPGDAVGGWTEKTLEPWLRAGGGLLVFTGRDGGPEDAFALGRLLPTSAWHTLIYRLKRGEQRGPLQAAGGDTAFFNGLKAPDVTLGYHYDIRPRPAVEGGNWRYERFARKDTPVDFDKWSRPIANRDARVRLWGGEITRPPLLVTGRYGAGRVAVVATGPEAVSGPNTAEFFKSIFEWLAGRHGDEIPVSTAGDSPAKTAGPAIVRPAWEGDGGGWNVKAGVELPARQLVLQLKKNAAPQEVELVLRMATWERAPVEDRILILKPDRTGRVVVDLPAPGPQTVDALDVRDAFWIRLGLLEEGGRIVALESPWFFADATASARVSLQTASIDDRPYPFNASGVETLFWRARMGAHIGQLAFPPGAEVEAKVDVSNALRNLAPAAGVRDLQRQDHTLARTLNDLAFHRKGPRDNVQAWGTWSPDKSPQPAGVAFTFTEPAVVYGITLSGDAGGEQCPPTVTIQAGDNVLTVEDLAARLEKGKGRAWIELPKVTATRINLLFPGSSQKARVAEVEIFGHYASEKSNALKGQLSVVAINALTGEKRDLATEELALEPGTSRQIPVKFTMPDPGANLGLWQLEAEWAGTRVEVPVMGLRADKALQPRESLQTKNDVFHNFIVTRGLRNTGELGTGNRDTSGSWGTSDDFIYAHARLLKQTKWDARMRPGLLFSSDADFRHYVNPWGDFPNGEPFFGATAKGLLAGSQKSSNWAAAERVVFGFSDRWDPGPATDQLFAWPGIIAFDEWLRTGGAAGLKGRTRIALCEDIRKNHLSAWNRFNEKRYVAAVSLLSETYKKEGKTLVITAQGKPLLPLSSAALIAETVQGMSDDSTWELHDEDIPFTTARQMAAMAWNPNWRYSTLLQWGWNSIRCIWHAPVGTAEPSRRHYYDRAWRGVRLPGGVYRSMHTFGFNQNGYESWTMTEHDWQQWWNLKERHALIDPQAPLGAALVVGTARFESPEFYRFSGGGMGGNELGDILNKAATVQSVLQRAGVSIPYSANARDLGGPEKDRALIVVGLAQWIDADLKLFNQWVGEKRPIIAVEGETDQATRAALLARLQTLAGQPETLGTVLDRPVQRFGSVLLLPVTEAELGLVGLPGWEDRLRSHLRQALVFAPGTAGYAFHRGSQVLSVIEDWLEHPRTVEIKLNKSVLPGKPRAASMNGSVPLEVREEGDFWIAKLPLRNGDADVICWEPLP